MEKENNNKGVIALLVVIIIILLSLVILLATGTISFKNTKKTGNNEVNNIETDTITYHMVQSELIATVVYSNNDPTDSANKRVGDKMYIVFPVINYNNDAISQLNAKVKANVDDAINKIINYKDSGGSCEKFKIAKTGEEKQFDHFIYNEYLVLESDEYLSILEAKSARSTCASGFNAEVINTYVVNKTDKSVLYNADLINKVNKKELLEYIKNNFKESEWIYEKSEAIEKISKVINENKYHVYYDKDNNISVIIAKPEMPGTLTTNIMVVLGLKLIIHFKNKISLFKYSDFFIYKN